MISDPVNKQLSPYGRYLDYMIAKSGRMYGALEFSGIDPKSLNSVDFKVLTDVFRRILQVMDSDVGITQYTVILTVRVYHLLSVRMSDQKYYHVSVKII